MKTDFCCCVNGFIENLPPQNSDLCHFCHILITNEQVQRQNFGSACFYNDFLNLVNENVPNITEIVILRR
jgi:hypothetical protein